MKYEDWAPIGFLLGMALVLLLTGCTKTSPDTACVAFCTWTDIDIAIDQAQSSRTTTTKAQASVKKRVGK
jgi:hypothetical protein